MVENVRPYSDCIAAAAAAAAAAVVVVVAAAVVAGSVVVVVAAAAVVERDVVAAAVVAAPAVAAAVVVVVAAAVGQLDWRILASQLEKRNPVEKKVQELLEVPDPSAAWMGRQVADSSPCSGYFVRLRQSRRTTEAVELLGPEAAAPCAAETTAAIATNNSVRPSG